MLSSKDINFVGYTYKNFEIVNDHQLPGIGNFPPYSSLDIYLALSCRDNKMLFGFLIQTFIIDLSPHTICLTSVSCGFPNAAELKKKSSKIKRPSIKTLFGKVYIQPLPNLHDRKYFISLLVF